MPVALLDRNIIRLSGAEVKDWLTGLITNSLSGEITFAALLTPQGKIIADFFVIKDGQDYLIDTASKFAATLQKRLKLYKLRAKIEITETDLSAYAVWDGHGDEGFVDPRDVRLGRRLYATGLEPSASEGDYDAHRLALGIPDSTFDFDTGDMFPADACMDLLQGVDYKKGCFVGQEVVSRMHRKTTVRKRMRAFRAANNPADKTIRAAEVKVGDILHTHEGYGMALIRTDKVGKADAPLIVGDTPITLSAPVLHVRRNDPRDLRAFAELNIAWIRDMHSVEASDQYMYDHPEGYMENGNSVFTVLVGQTVAGVCALKQDEDGAWELTKMAVDPAFQGFGIGKLLMQTIEAYARYVMGLQKIYLLTSTINAAAIRLYKREGWVKFLDGEHPKYSRCNIGFEKDL